MITKPKRKKRNPMNAEKEALKKELLIIQKRTRKIEESSKKEAAEFIKGIKKAFSKLSPEIREDIKTVFAKLNTEVQKIK